jgi:hypothetical protein
MPIHETDAFVLRTYALADRQDGVFFGRDGECAAWPRGRKLRSRFGASLEPFTEVASAIFRPNRKSAEYHHARSSATFDLITSGEMRPARHWNWRGFMPGSNERVYRLIGATLRVLQGNASNALHIRYFESDAQTCGLFPDLRPCGLCQRESGQDGQK